MLPGPHPRLLPPRDRRLEAAGADRLAATTIAAAGVRDAGEGVLVVAYVVVATARVWGPVILFEILGKRAVTLMQEAQGEVVRHQPQVTIYALLVLAALLVIDAIGVLLT